MGRRPLKHVHQFTDRHGKPRYYFRRPGFKSVALPGSPFSDEFMEAYQAALNNRERPAIGANRVLPFSIRFLAVSYYSSTEFLALKASTAHVRRLIIDRFCRETADGKANGDRSAATLKRRDVERMMATRASKPESANGLHRALRALMKHAVAVSLREDDPTQGVRRIKSKTGGFHSWTEEEIALYRQRHPLGSTPRLALELLLGTAQRRSDVVRMGRQHTSIENGWTWMKVIQDKTSAELSIPLLPEVLAAVDMAPPTNLTFLLTRYGKPYSPASFGNIFRRWCDGAGLPHCSAHGLRKAAARRFAEAGFTHEQIKAWTGHRSARLVDLYVRAAQQKKLAQAGAEIITGTSTHKPAPRFAKSGRKS
jgi:integrase